MVRRFLAEAVRARPSLGKLAEEAGPYRMALPALGCSFQTLEAPALRRSLGLKEPMSGVLISRIRGEGQSSLQPWDVLLEFDGHVLDNLGFCEVLGRRLHFTAALD